jgi:hypothetical protein
LCESTWSDEKPVSAPKVSDDRDDTSQDSNNNSSNQNDLESERTKPCERHESTDGLTITSCCSPHDPSGENRVCIKGRFLAINAATMSCRCGHSKYGISPSQHLGNGCCDLIVVGQCTRKDYLKYLLRTGFSEKSAVSLRSDVSM